MTRMKPSVKIPQLKRWEVDKFWNNDNFVVNPKTQCLEWQGYSDPRGYGKIGLHGKLFNVHRIAYFIYYAEDPGELLVRHKCNNSRCSNPLHLELGTHFENSQDMVQSGRVQRGETHWSKRLPERLAELREMHQATGRRLAAEINGEKHPCTVLTAEIVREIKTHSANGVSNRDLAEIFNVTHSNISAIVLGKSWAHIEGEVRAKDTRFSSKLTPANVRKIRELHAKGYSKEALAREFKIGSTSIGKVIDRKSYKYIE